VQKGADVVFSCAFGLREYNGEPLETSTELFDRYYAYSGDLVGGCAGIVEIKEDCFNVVHSTNVYKFGECKRKLLADALLMVFTKISDGATQSEKVDTQKTVFVPYKLVPLLAKVMPTKDAFLIAHDWATNGGSVDSCINLLNLL